MKGEREGETSTLRFSLRLCALWTPDSMDVLCVARTRALLIGYLTLSDQLCCSIGVVLTGRVEGTELSYKKKVSETVTLQLSITTTPCSVNMSTSLGREGRTSTEAQPPLGGCIHRKSPRRPLSVCAAQHLLFISSMQSQCQACSMHLYCCLWAAC